MSDTPVLTKHLIDSHALPFPLGRGGPVAVYLAADVDALLSASPRPAGGWQPMDSAPESGWIVAWCGAYAQVVRFTGTLFFDEGGEVALISPTHWMPLPPLPVPPRSARTT